MVLTKRGSGANGSPTRAGRAHRPLWSFVERGRYFAMDQLFLPMDLFWRYKE